MDEVVLNRLAPLLLILVLVGCKYQTKQEANDACNQWAETTRYIKPQAKEINDRLIARALKMGGTCTGEHGVGLGKKDHLRKEKGISLDVMSQIKKALDPNNIMNPGKIF